VEDDIFKRNYSNNLWYLLKKDMDWTLCKSHSWFVGWLNILLIIKHIESPWFSTLVVISQYFFFNPRASHKGPNSKYIQRSQ